jgi:hypothetical protein
MGFFSHYFIPITDCSCKMISKFSIFYYPLFHIDEETYDYILMSNCFPSFILRWILNFVDQHTHESWYPTNKSDFTVHHGEYKLIFNEMMRSALY